MDDEKLILSAFQRLLRSHPYHVHTATNTQEAETHLNKNSTHLLICDYKLNGEDGLSFLKRVQKQWPEIPRILLTGFPDSKLAERALNEARIFRFLTKPWDEKEVLTIIKKGLEKQDLLIQNKKLFELTQKQQERLSKLHHELEVRSEKIQTSKKIIQKKKAHLAIVYNLLAHLAESKSLSDIIAALAKDTKKVVSFDTFTLVTSDYKILTDKGTSLNFDAQHAAAPLVEELFTQRKPLIKNSHLKNEPSLFNNPEKAHSVLLYPLVTKFGQKEKCAGILNLARFTNEPFTHENIENLEEISGPLAVAINKILLYDIIQAGTRQWEQTFDTIEDPLTIIDRNYNIIKANQAAAKVFARRSVKELKWKKCYEVLAHNDKPCTNCPMEKSLKTKTPSEAHELRAFKDKDISTWSFPVVNKDGSIEFIVQYYKDLTKEKEMYRRLVQSEKMSAVGLLTSSVAHEVNNPITGILGLSQILHKELPENHPHIEDITEIERAALRCKEIIENLLGFSKELNHAFYRKKAKKSWVKINDIVDSTLSLVRFSSEKKAICIEKKFSQNLPKIKAHASELQQVFFNIFNNAYQAIDKQGTIEITTQTDKNGIQISVRDTGCGISQDNLPHIFDPFFTTKQKGKGTGLGLSVSRDIIKKYSGSIEVQSEVGKGSVFTIKIPKTSKE